MAKKKVLIIGAGMSGLVCAIDLAKKGHKVTVFERNNRIGKKILVTGNGRCNLSNVKASKE
jgi:predicted flavoprotein YhiN